MFCQFVYLLCSSGVFYLIYSRIATFLVGLLFSFVNDYHDESVEMLSFPPSIFGSMIFALFAATFVIYVLASRDFGLFFILLRFW